MTVTPLGQDQDCSLKIREPNVPTPWFLDPGGWSKTAAVSLYFIFLESVPCPLAFGEWREEHEFGYIERYTLVHCIDDITVIGASEHEVATTLDKL
ncbi:hypothetical protein STEG23_036251, partial [Scotinomys teguina]